MMRCPDTVTRWVACSSARCVELAVVVLEVLDVLARCAELPGCASPPCCVSPVWGAAVAVLVVSCACAAVQIATTARANGFRERSRIDGASGIVDGDPGHRIARRIDPAPTRTNASRASAASGPAFEARWTWVDGDCTHGAPEWDGSVAANHDSAVKK